jgi:hypothetical protein
MLGHTVCGATSAILAGVVCGAVFAAEPASELERALVKDADLTLHLRSYFFDRRKPGPDESAALAAGGWLGYQTGWFADFLRLGAVGYTSQPLWAPDDKDGTLLLEPGQQGYTVLGQAFVGLKAWDQVFTGYRQLINQPEVNAQDNRMTPNTFEAYTLTGKLYGVEYTGGLVTDMKPRNEDQFFDMARVAGAPSGTNRSMWLGGVGFKPVTELALRLSGYHVEDILSSGYADAAWTAQVFDAYRLVLGGQFMAQGSNGDERLTGASFDTWAVGLKVDVTRGPLTLTAVHTRVDDRAAYRAPYGSWAGYTAMVVRDFNRAGESSWLGAATFDFAGVGVTGLVFNFAAVYGYDAINPSNRVDLSDNTEYDATLDYRFTWAGWPEWLRSFWIRARASRLEERLNGNNDITMDYRLILNYEVTY